MPSVFVVSLGCAKNLVDAEIMLGSLRKSGFEPAVESKTADCILINTCSFLSASRQEARQEIRKAVKNKKEGAVVAVTGCFVSSHPEKLQKLFPGVRIFIPFARIPETGQICLAALKKRGRVLLPAYLKKTFLYDSGMPRVLATLPHQAYIKIGDGCDNCCSYCLIPSIRGNFRSRPLKDIVLEAKKLAALGVREINLISQDTTRYGEDLYGRPVLAKLLKELVKVKGIDWLRVLYMYPSRVTDELLETMAGLKKVAPYFDIPLQHTEDRLLKLMRRTYLKEDIEKLLERIKRKVKNAVIRTTLITGFPGETRQEFEAMLAFIGRVKFNKLGVFAFSKEKGTPAYALPGGVSEPEKKRRLKALMTGQQKVSLQLNKEKIGSKIEVLVDTLKNGTAAGRTLGDAPDVDGRVYFPVVTGDNRILPGDIITVKVLKALPYDLIGEAFGD